MAWAVRSEAAALRRGVWFNDVGVAYAFWGRVLNMWAWPNGLGCAPSSG